MMMREPRQVVDVIGKLLAAVGPYCILWGTDRVWRVAPAPHRRLPAFMIPVRMQDESATRPDRQAKVRILSTDAAEPYGIDLDQLGWPPSGTPGPGHHRPTRRHRFS